MSEAELADLEVSIAELRRQPSADSFSRIVNEISMHRRLQTGPRHRRSYQSFASSEDARSSHSRLSSVDEDASVSGVLMRTCCCQQPDCEVARRVMQHMQDMEMDLQLSAEIGQALLQRQDAIVHRSQQESEEHALQRDQLLSRLTQSIKETQSLQRQLSQAQFNLEAADQSHHALLSELENARQQMKQMKMHRIKASSLQAKLERAEVELEDMRAELRAEQRRAREAAVQHQQLIARRCLELSDRLQDSIREEASTTQEAYSKAWNAVRARLDAAYASNPDAAEPDDDLEAILRERDVLQTENRQLQQLLRGAQDELLCLREASEASPAPLPVPPLSADLSHGASDTSHSEATTDEMRGSDGTAITTPSTSRACLEEDAYSHDTGSLRGFDSERDFELTLEHRTGLLSALIEAMHRAYTKLQQADIDTLSARLQRQKLAGDVGHLSRTTVQASVRDVEGLKEHFRKMVEKETRRGVCPDGSLVTRRDFFALVKLQRESLLELARLRRCLNEIQLNPQGAAKLLNEHLGAQTLHTGRSWISRMFTGVLSSETPTATAEPNVTPVLSGLESGIQRMGPMDGAAAPMAMPRRSAAPPSRMLPRSGAAALSTSVAVHAHGMHAAGKPSVLKAKASQPCLVEAAQRPPRRPLANISNGPPATRPWDEPLHRPRARGLSDSSIHSTFLEHGAPAPEPTVDRVITPATLTLSGHEAGGSSE